MDKRQKTIIKINKNTKSGEIKWRLTQAPPSIISKDEQLSGPAYTTQIEETSLLIIKYRTKYYIEDSIDGYSWIERACLFTIDRNLPTYDFENYDLVEDLYNSVQYQTSNVDNFMNKLLADENDDDETSPWDV